MGCGAQWGMGRGGELAGQEQFYPSNNSLRHCSLRPPQVHTGVGGVGEVDAPRMPLTLTPSTVSQHSGVLTNHLGTSASSPTSESDNHALLDEKEDSYFSEIRNFIANSEMNQASTRMDKR